MKCRAFIQRIRLWSERYERYEKTKKIQNSLTFCGIFIDCNQKKKKRNSFEIPIFEETDLKT